MNTIEIKNISKVYKSGDSEVHALDDVSFEIEKGSFNVILGASGAGKSTLLNIIGGMESPTSGSYIFDGNEISKYNEKQLVFFRREKIGFVFQFYNLFPNLTALENISLSASLVNNPLEPFEILDKVGLKDKAKNFPSQLSGGEQQRIAIARAIVKNPDLILCDEPTGALDSVTGGKIISLLLDVSKNYGKTVIVVTHNSKIADCAHRTLTLSDGKLIKDEISKNPIKPENIEW